MFGANSRYAKSPIVDARTRDGKSARVVAVRRLPYVPGNLTEVKGVDRLDLMAHRKYQDGTKFWRVADANTELEANRLVQSDRPENPQVRDETRLIVVPQD
jgi:hypothetical protein